VIGGSHDPMLVERGHDLLDVFPSLGQDPLRLIQALLDTARARAVCDREIARAVRWHL
jgi:hypothetical protein